jgi:hypothetical protein
MGRHSFGQCKNIMAAFARNDKDNDKLEWGRGLNQAPPEDVSRVAALFDSFG